MRFTMYGQASDYSGWLCNFGYFMPGPFGMIFSLLLLAAVILLIVKIFQVLFSSKKRSADSSSMRILKDRYAAGEISKEQFEQIQRDIS